MRKYLSILLALSMILALFAGCGGQTDEATPPETQGSTETVQTDETEATEAVVSDAPYDHFTVVFDKNTTPDDLTDDESFNYFTAGWDSQKKFSIKEIPYSEDAYIPSSEVPTPTRKGYYFAGWQTVPVVTEDDLINGISKYQVFFDTKLTALGVDQVNQASAEEVETRQLCQEVQYIKDFETLTEDGTLTLYARWVEAKEVSTEEELRAMSNDLYGAYILTNDITLTEPWTPIGYYFGNYEYYNVDWWAYAFRGTLDGNGYAIHGMVINGADIENPDWYGSEGAIWHNDGLHCKGVAAMFGAISYGTIKNLTLDSPVINIAGDYAFSGDYLYVGSVTCFDMASTLNSVTVLNPQINVEYSDTNLKYRDSLFLTVAGMEAGGWSSTVSKCTVADAKINVNVTSENSHGGEVYVGGMIGENYATIIKAEVSADITYNGQDIATAEEDAVLRVNVGGLGAAHTSSKNSTIDANLDVTISKPVGASEVSIGGVGGAQRYMTADSDTVNAVITTNLDLDPEQGTSYIGAVIGRYDVFYGPMILMYADSVHCGCVNNTTTVTLNGEPLTAAMPENGYPMLNGEIVTYIARVDVTDAEGNVYKANVDEILAAYGGYTSKEAMVADILYIDIQ